MSDAGPHKDEDALLLQALVDALYGLRDAWVRTSLYLQDLQFQVDKEQRSAASEQLQQLLDRINRH